MKLLRKMTTRNGLSRTFHALSNPPSKHHPHPYLTLLSSCKSLKTLLQIHAHLILSGGLPHDNFTSTHLIDAYSSFQKPETARIVFDSTPTPRAILYNTMIRAYTRSNQHTEAIELYHDLLDKEIQPDKYTYTSVLKACTGVGDSKLGFLVHHDIVSKGLENDVFLGTGLVDMYSKIGDFGRAREVFEKMPVKDVVVWNAMIAGLSQSEEPREGLSFFRVMQSGARLEPTSVSLLNVFPAICKLLDIKSCKAIHGYVCKRCFPSAVSNGLIDTYSKCGNVDVARKVFDRMWGLDDVSWGTMMAGYVHNGHFCEVLDLFDYIKRENLKMNKVSAVSALLAAAEMRDLDKGMEIHECAIQQRIDSNVLVATPLMTMYAKCGELEKAKNLFRGLQGRDLVAWSAVIAAFVQSGYHIEALSLFREMQNENIKANRVTLVSVLPACAELLFVKLGKSLHCYALRTDTDSEVSMGTALVSMYAKCDCFNLARTLFNKMPLKDVVTWNALINGYAQIGDPYNAMEMFYQLQSLGVQPDSGSMVGVVPACALIGDLHQGACIHGQIIKRGFESDCHVKNALIDMYAKCGSLSTAEFLFKGAEFARDLIAWNVMIAGYMQNGQAKEAISLFHLMKVETFQPNLVTIVSILPAAAILAALKEGMAFHAYIVQMGFRSNTLVANSLIDMYAKCTRLDCAEKIFDETRYKDLISWNAMLAGYSMHGCGDHATAFFALMKESHVEIDSVSFVSVLSACRHVGLVEEGRKIFHSMREKHQVEPGLEHYACMVDLLGRAGLFDETLGLIETMPMEADAGVWGALLGACNMHSNVMLAEVALNNLVKLEPGNPAHYVVLSSIYAQSGRWDEANSTRLKMNETRLKRNPGCSWIEVRKPNECISSG